MPPLSASYKLFEPDYHPQKPLIVGLDDVLASPESLSLQYEEASRLANGGSPTRDSPPRLMDMASYKAPSALPSMHGYDPNRYSHTAYEPYQPPTYSTPPQTTDKFAQLNQQAFASNGAVSPVSVASFMQTAPFAAVLSCQPTTGVAGTKVYVRFSLQYDMSESMAVPNLQFGEEMCTIRDAQRNLQEQGYVYDGSVEAPRQHQMMMTGGTGSVALSLVVDGPAGDEISRTGAGSFQYMAQGQQGTGSHPDDDVTRAAPTTNNCTSPNGATQDTVPGSSAFSSSCSSSSTSLVPSSSTNPTAVPTTHQSAVSDHASVSPKTAEPQLASSGAGVPQQALPVPHTNNYEEPSQHGPYANTGYTQGPTTGDMNTTAYRSSTFTDPYHSRRSTHGWNSGYATTTLGSSSLRSPLLRHGRHRGGLPIPSSTIGSNTGSGSQPVLVRTSTINTSGSSGSTSPYNAIPMYSNKASLELDGAMLDSMIHNWTPEEFANKRRLVMFRRVQHGTKLSVSFKPVDQKDRPQHAPTISCIYWDTKGQYFVTSVDTIHLLEQLVAAPNNRFSVEEKNRIRRNLEGYHPITVSKSKDESEEFFKTIMQFPNPKPRNIEKDVKVFPWHVLKSALGKIIGKYSASPNNALSASNMVAASPSPYAAALPTPPGHGSISSQTSDHHGAASQYSVHNHHEAIPSPRSLSGSGPSWTPYTSLAPPYSTTASTSTNGRALSPGLRQPSPGHHHGHHHQQPAPSVRGVGALPSVMSYDTRGGYAPTAGLQPPSHHSLSFNSDPYPSLSSTHHSSMYTSPYLASSASRA